MDPEDWADIVNEAVAEMAGCVDRYGGTVAQFAGDSILAVFGAPIAHEDDPYRAVRAGLDIVGRVGRSDGASRGIQVRAGIHTGLVVIGDMSAGDLNVYAVLGDTTNVAARMQTMAEPGSLLVTADTYRLVSNDVTARDLGPVAVKGKAEPISVFEITSARDISTRRRGIPGFRSPMVGRDEELDHLLTLVDYAAAGSGRVTAVVGEPGVGKSRLIAELHDRVATVDGARWVVGRSASYDQERPYHLAASLVLALAGAAETDDPPIARKAVVKTADPIFGVDSPSTGYLLQLLGIEDGHPDDDPAVLHSQYDAALAGLIEGVATEHAPLILICEDMHWADASSTELLTGLLERIQQTTALLIIATRPDRDSHGWGIIARADRELGESFTSSRLQPLNPDTSRELVANLLEIESLPHDIRALVLSRAEGNPFFIEELVRMLVERDLIEEVDDRWIASGAISTLDVPDTLHGLLASRLDALPTDVRRTAMVAAVIGRRFEARLVASALQSVQAEGPSAVGGHLNTLEGHGVVKLAETRPELAYSFRHALTHDVAYESILRRDRRRLHADVGDAIADLYPERLAELSPVLARHYEEAEDPEQALRYLLLAGDTALSRHAMPESHGFYARAAALLAADPDAPVETKVDVALSQAEAGIRFTPADQTIAVLEEARDDAEQLDDTELLARVYALLLRVRTLLDENYANSAYREVMDRAYALAPLVRTPEVRAFLEGMMGQVLRSADEYAAAVELASGSVAPLEAAGRVGEAGFNAAITADVEASRGRFGEADRWITRATDLAAASGNPNVIADVELMKGRIAAARGELATALTHTRLGMETAEGAGNIQCTLVGNFLVADQVLRGGDAMAAIPYLERTFELGAYCNAEAMVALGHAWLAAAQARLGELDPDGFAAPLEKARAAGSRSGEASVRLHRAIAIAGTSPEDWSATFLDFERAVALYADIGARPDQARALHAYANALEAAGQTTDGRAKLAEARAMFDEMGITPDRVAA